MTGEFIAALGIGFGLLGGATLLVFILRDQRSRIVTIEQMLQEFVPDKELQQFFNGQDKKMSDFVTTKDYEAHQEHCRSEFKHGRERMDTMDKKLDSIVDKLEPMSKNVAILADRAKLFRGTD